MKGWGASQRLRLRAVRGGWQRRPGDGGSVAGSRPLTGWQAPHIVKPRLAEFPRAKFPRAAFPRADSP